MRHSLHLGLGLVIEAAIVIVLAGVENSILRILVGLLLVLVLPGYTVMAAVFPGKKLDTVVRLMVIVGVSLAVTVITGFLLNLTPWGLSADTWAVALGDTAFVANGIAWYRSYNLPVARVRIPISLRQSLIFALAVVLIIAALQVARIGAMESQQTGFTQFWMLPDHQPNTVTVGIANREAAAVKYRVDVKVNGTVLREWSPPALQAGETWTETLTVPAGQNAVAELYRLDHPESVYRRVELWQEK